MRMNVFQDPFYEGKEIVLGRVGLVYMVMELVGEWSEKGLV
jgi:hypothetical protein